MADSEPPGGYKTVQFTGGALLPLGTAPEESYIARIAIAHLVGRGECNKVYYYLMPPILIVFEFFYLSLHSKRLLVTIKLTKGGQIGFSL